MDNFFNNNIIYKEFNLKYLKNMVILANIRFGDNYINEKMMLNYIRKDNICTIAINEKSDEIVGFCIFYGVGISEATSELKISKDELLNVSGPKPKICIAKTMAVNKNVENKGIGSYLFKNCMAKAKNAGYTTVWAACWKIDDRIPMKEINEKNNFLFFKTVHLIWYDNKEYKCKICNGPCKCDAALYYRII